LVLLRQGQSWPHVKALGIRDFGFPIASIVSLRVSTSTGGRATLTNVGFRHRCQTETPTLIIASWHQRLEANPLSLAPQIFHIATPYTHLQPSQFLRISSSSPI
ncbi:hypothetical protein M758_5G141200, partial [Ceratodon purpureus]